jgi:Family of unknown function (DUF6263)
VFVSYVVLGWDCFKMKECVYYIFFDAGCEFDHRVRKRYVTRQRTYLKKEEPMHTRSVVLPFVLAAALACGQKPTDKSKDKKDPLLIKPPTNNTQPVSMPDKPNTMASTMAASTMATSAPTDSLLLGLPSLSSYLSKGVEVEKALAFSYNFEKGKSASYQISIRWQLKGINLPLGDFSGAFVADLNWVIKDVDSKGEALAELTYGRIQAQFDAILLGGSKKFDSKSKDQIVPDPLLAPFGKMDGKTFSMKISKEGKISELTGQDKILQEALSDSSFPADLRLQILAAIGEQGLTQLLGQGFLAFPAKELKKGDNFKTDGAPLTIPGLGEINLQEDIRLEGLREIDGKQLGLFSISIFALIDPQGGPSVTKLPGFRLAGEATPTIGDGFFVFDVGRGLPSSATLPIPLDLKISLLQSDGTATTPQPINVIGDVTLTAKLVE